MLSNALKFSPKSSSINIYCKYISKVSDLSDQVKHAEHFEKAKHGMIEIKVVDQGIGI